MVKSIFSFWYYMYYLILTGFSIPAIYGITHPGQMITIKNGVRENGLIMYYVFLGTILFNILFHLIKSVVLEVWSDRLVLRRLFSHTTIYKKDITSIDLMARKKKRIGRLSRQFVDAIVIDRGTSQIRIWLNFYQNGPEIKRAIQGYLLPVQADLVSGRLVPAETVPDRPPVTYSRSWLTSGYGLMSFGVLIMGGLIFFTLGTGHLAVRVGLFVALAVLVYFYFGVLQHYFIVDEEELIVRNHFFRWYEKRFSLVKIRSAIIEDGIGKIALRITMMDFECKSFIAGSLRQPEWKALAKRLGEKGVPVVDEAYW